MSDETPIFLDHHSTTPCDRRVVEAMLPYLSEEFGNAASRTHAFGWRAEQAAENARRQVAGLIGADAREIVFTSGATESNNLALFGAARAARVHGDHIISCQTEHPAVLDSLRALEREGFRVTRLGVSPDGLLHPGKLEAAIEPGTVLISIMHANNEIGVIQPVAQLAALARERGVLFHTDAAQSAGKIPVDVKALSVDLLSFTAHKLYGPKGVGALFVRRRHPRIPIEPLIHGGGHERGLRAGTLPVPLCVGFGRAAEIALESMESDALQQRDLRERLWNRLAAGLDSLELNGHPDQRLPGNLNVSFLGAEGEALLLAVPGVALSSGSACSSAKRESSHVLRALGVGELRAQCALRIGIGRGNTGEEVDVAADQLIEQTRRLRKLSPAWDEPGRSGRRGQGR
ncbi:MAG: aminotransferase class V-fold PLP-dependent enzyme [bacterium]|nr:aminotransferase class V-fold PLP-dependent enzyme [bacterium]